jgi:DSF synthase
LVDVLADDGDGEGALHAYVRGARRRHKTLGALARVRHALVPISHADLVKVVDIWVDTALELDPRDLKMMERLAGAQGRAFAQPAMPLAQQGANLAAVPSP